MSSDDGLNYLLQAAVASPDTWFSIHRTAKWMEMVNGKEIERTAVPGNAHKDHAQALEDAMYWAHRRGQCVYLAQGAYRNTAGPGVIYPKALRQEPNLLACKNLYMDIDVKSKAYATTNDALKGLQEFLIKAQLPCPTVIVGSGNGGLHVYWTLDETFDVREFRRMAGQLVEAARQSGVFFDQNCTNDPTRLLRVPNTLNFKDCQEGEPGKPVILMHLDKTHIKLSVMQKALAPFKPAAQPSSNPTGKPSVNDDLGGGMGRDFKPANIDTVAQHCPFIAETLEKGGANLVGEPHWKLAVGLSCHCDDPSKTVHRLCHNGENYSFDGTEAKLAVHLQARKDRPTIGPEKCVTIKGLGIPHCATCPHLHLGTTPLSVSFKQPGSHTHKGAAVNPYPNSVDLPKPYYRGADDLIYYSRDNGEGGMEQVLVFDHPLLPGSASVEAGDPYMFVFDTILGERIVTKRLPTNIIANNNAFMEALSRVGISITVKPDLARTFVANYIKMLTSSKDTHIDAPAFGWSLDRKEEMGFAFAGKFFSPNGTFKASRPGAGVEDYRMSGHEKPWRDLASIILTPQRPDLCCMGASSFASPLVEMTGHAGLLLGLISAKSGIGKSTALLLGQAVWSKPVVGGLSDTVVYTFAKCAMLRHLPLFYDEIKGEKQINSMTELAFQLTGGREKGRANRMGAMREVKEFKTLCGYAANGSIVAAVRDQDKGTDASWLRMFEMHAIDAPNTEEEFAYAVNEHLTELHLNFGGIGLKYAEFLGKHHNDIHKMLVETQKRVALELSADPKVHRYWIDAVTTVMLGGLFANKLGFCNFPLDEMQAYMYAEYHRMRQEMTDDPSDFGTERALASTIGSFINEKLPRNMIVVDKAWTQPGRPPKNSVKILNNKLMDTGWGQLEVQLSETPLILRISDNALGVWCKRTNRPKPNLTAAMKKRWNAELSMMVIGSGTHKAGAKENVWVINAAGTSLEDTLRYIIAQLTPSTT